MEKKQRQETNGIIREVKVALCKEARINKVHEKKCVHMGRRKKIVGKNTNVNTGGRLKKENHQGRIKQKVEDLDCWATSLKSFCLS